MAVEGRFQTAEPPRLPRIISSSSGNVKSRGIISTNTLKSRPIKRASSHRASRINAWLEPGSYPAPPRGYAADASSLGRRCVHCGNQKTPQWRAGPAGAKTLCNACGVRYKNGRLNPRVVYPPHGPLHGNEEDYGEDEDEEDEGAFGGGGGGVVGGRIPHLSAKRIAEAAAYGASPPFVPHRQSAGGGGAQPPPAAPHIPKKARGSAAATLPALPLRT